MSQYDLMLYLKIKLWPVFHGSVILPYILKAIWCINMILWAWPQNKSWSLWPIFHGSVILAYILKTILCIRRWHWPGVYVSPCSLALVLHKLAGLKEVQEELLHYLRHQRWRRHRWRRGHSQNIKVFTFKFFYVIGELSCLVTGHIGLKLLQRLD